MSVSDISDATIPLRAHLETRKYFATVSSKSDMICVSLLSCEIADQSSKKKDEKLLSFGKPNEIQNNLILNKPLPSAN